MSKISSIICFFLAAGFAAITLWFVFNPIETKEPCGCSTNDWKLGTLWQIRHNQNLIFKPMDCSMLGCAPEYKIFPTDTAAASIIFLAAGIWLRRKRQSE